MPPPIVCRTGVGAKIDIGKAIFGRFDSTQILPAILSGFEFERWEALDEGEKRPSFWVRLMAYFLARENASYHELLEADDDMGADTGYFLFKR